MSGNNSFLYLDSKDEQAQKLVQTINTHNAIYGHSETVTEDIKGVLEELLESKRKAWLIACFEGQSIKNLQGLIAVLKEGQKKNVVRKQKG